jgi:heme-degrading monooxygenase HmoA
MRVRVLVSADIQPENAAAFESAYAQVSAKVKGTPGHIRDELLRDGERAGHYILAGEWENREAFLSWENAPIHMQTTSPLRPYWAGRVQRNLYDIIEPTTREKS